ncbi:MAG: phospho-sugar mutase [Clostridia bacterium]|nr:phospho-sugar mutase [Clostridia bacterium]
MSDYKARYEFWKTNDFFDEATRAELAALTDEKEIEDRFYRDLEFGTGGARGIMGAGTNRFNSYNVRRISTGFAKYLLKAFGEDAKKRGVAVAFDTRNNSAEYARQTALTMCAAGIPAYLYTMTCPTPMLSFTVRQLNCVGGVIVTASHNTKEYNGYKAYDETGCQLYPYTADAVIAEVDKVDITSTVIMDEKEAADKGLLHYLGSEMMDRYVKAVEGEEDYITPGAKAALKVVYTPLHGAGFVPVTRVLKDLGYTGVSIVEAQTVPDGNFPTVTSPNPGDESAMQMAIKQAVAEGADIAIGSDPDADRIGMAIIRKDGSFRFLSGNQICAMLINYVLMRRKDKLKPNSCIITTVVTSEFGSDIARSYGLSAEEVLTGFKFIGERMNRLEESGEKTVEFGYEESNGCLIGDYVRDKDSATALMKICEMTAFYKAHGKNMDEVLEGLYQKHGYYLDHLDNYVFTGKEGAEKIASINRKLREIGTALSPDIQTMKDFEKGVDGLPPSDVLKYWFKDGSWLAIRPSGTEPKTKVYYCIHDNDQKAAADNLAKKQKLIKDVIDSL